MTRTRRMSDLAERIKRGDSPRGAGRAREFVKAGHLLALLHSKARIAEGQEGDERLWTGRFRKSESERVTSVEYCHASVLLSHGPVSGRPYHRATTRRNHSRQPGPLSCLHDNTHKGPNIAGIDPLTRRSPSSSTREDKWDRHFRWDGHRWGRTAVGQTSSGW